MVKLLKFILFIILMAFSFALGVRFSDSFKNSPLVKGSDSAKTEEEMKKAFDGIEEAKPIIEKFDANPLT